MGLLELPRLHISPRLHFLLTRGFDVTDADGSGVGTIEGGSTRLELKDPSGELIAIFGRPWRFLRSHVDVWRAPKTYVGKVEEQTPFGRVRAALYDEVGASAGAIEPVGFGATTFSILDGQGRQVGELARRWRFWRTGDYEIRFDEGAPGLRVLVVAAVVAIDKIIDGRRTSSSPP